MSHAARRSLLASLTGLAALAAAACSADAPTATRSPNAGSLVAVGATQDERARGPFTLSSPAFGDGQTMPSRYFGPPGADFGCYKSGENLSPPLRWSGAPAGTEEFAILVDDPDAPAGGGTLPNPADASKSIFTHWMTWGIDEDRRELKAGQSGPRVGSNDFYQYISFGVPVELTKGYFGPCPPAGDGVHHYRFHLFALNAHLKLRKFATRPEFDAALVGKVIQEVVIVSPLDTNQP